MIAPHRQRAASSMEGRKSPRPNYKAPLPYRFQRLPHGQYMRHSGVAYHDRGLLPIGARSFQPERAPLYMEIESVFIHRISCALAMRRQSHVRPVLTGSRSHERR